MLFNIHYEHSDYTECQLSSALPFKHQGTSDWGPARSDHRESLSWHVLVPRPAPLPGSVCVPVAIGRTGGGGIKELLCWCQSQMPSTTSTTTPPRHCLHSPSDAVRTGPCTDLQVAPLAGKVCQWSCPGTVNGAGCSRVLAPRERDRSRAGRFVFSRFTGQQKAGFLHAYSNWYYNPSTKIQ